jgi:hypothetical protein
MACGITRKATDLPFQWLRTLSSRRNVERRSRFNEA